MSLVKVEFVLVNGDVYQQQMDVAQAMEVMTEDHFVFIISDDEGNKECSVIIPFHALASVKVYENDLSRKDKS